MKTFAKNVVAITAREATFCLVYFAGAPYGNNLAITTIKQHLVQ